MEKDQTYTKEQINFVNELEASPNFKRNLWKNKQVLEQNVDYWGSNPKKQNS